MSREPEPLVGIAVPVRDAGRWLDAMLRSLSSQTYRNWRAVVVDDGSRDDSRSIADRHARTDPRISAVSAEPSGRGAPLARAYGRQVLGSAPSLLYFPDADDVLAAELLRTLVSRLLPSDAAVAAFCRYGRIDELGQTVNAPDRRRIALSTRWSRALRDDEPVTPFETIYAWAAPAAEAVTMFRAWAYDAAGGWEGWSSQGGESIDLLCRMTFHGSIVFEPSVLYHYRQHDRQHSSDTARLAEAARAIRAAWHERASGDPSVAARVARAEFFLNHRLTPRLGVAAARRRASSGNLVGATRFLLGAWRRYRWRAPPVGAAASRLDGVPSGFEPEHRSSDPNIERT